MHTALAVSTEGLVLGILNQKVYSRPEEMTNFQRTNYDFFELAHNLNSAVLVRASKDRTVNKKSRYPEQGEKKLWELIKSFHYVGTIEVEILAKDNKPKRTANLEVRFGSFMMNPSKNNIRHKTENLPNLPLYAVYVVEKDSLPEIDPLEWMLTITHKYRIDEQVAIPLINQRDVYILSKEHKVLVLDHFFWPNVPQVQEIASFIVGVTFGHLCIFTYKTFHSSSANKVVHGNRSCNCCNKENSPILITVRYLISLSAVPSFNFEARF